MIHTGIQKYPLDTSKLRTIAHSNSCGAVVTFEGTTRTPAGSQEVTSLEYEAYTELAEQQLADLALHARDFFEVETVVAVHCTGVVPVGDTGVVVMVGAKHRGAAFDAAEALMDDIKSQVAIWKKEHYSDGTSKWI